jgi:hypothetical protein
MNHAAYQSGGKTMDVKNFREILTILKTHRYGVQYFREIVTI